MKNIIVLFALLAFVSLSSCNNENATNTSGEYTPPAGTITETGTLTNWTYGSGFTLKLILNLPVKDALQQKVVLSYAPVESNGNFKIYYIPLIDSYYTDSLIFNSVYCIPNVIVTPISLKRTNTTLEIYYGDNYRGYLYDKSFKVGNDSVGTYYSYYRGFSSAGSFTGSNLCYLYNGTTFDTTTSNYNVNVVKGWMNYYSLVTSKTNRHTVYSNTNTQPPGEAIWHYVMN